MTSHENSLRSEMMFFPHMALLLGWDGLRRGTDSCQLKIFSKSSEKYRCVKNHRNNLNCGIVDLSLCIFVVRLDVLHMFSNSFTSTTFRDSQNPKVVLNLMNQKRGEVSNPPK